jgi:hypothetical protein
LTSLLPPPYNHSFKLYAGHTSRVTTIFIFLMGNMFIFHLKEIRKKPRVQMVWNRYELPVNNVVL